MSDDLSFRFHVSDLDKDAGPSLRVSIAERAFGGITPQQVESVFEALCFYQLDCVPPDETADGVIRISVDDGTRQRPVGPFLAKDERGRLYGTEAGWTWVGSTYWLDACYADRSVRLSLNSANRAISGGVRPKVASAEAVPLDEATFCSGPGPCASVLAYGLRHAVTALLPLTGWIPLHGAALSRDDTGVLITGPSGSGKSTLAAGLITRGWTCVSDDLLMIPPRERLPADPVTLFRLSRGVRLLPDARARLMPALADTSAAVLASEQRFGAENKEWFDLADGASVEPDVIMLPTIVDNETSTLAPTAAHVGLQVVLSQMPPVSSLPADAAQVLVESAGRIVRNTDVFELHAGRDLYADPGALSDLVEETRSYA